ncbi:MAG TPA: DUF222 domain-containing protein [Vicinamibacterales bacterium]|nr:DUF222 domain-containing protein [Vicinamibacterales bacterium]
MTPPLLSNTDSRSVEQLAEAIADIAAGIHAATYQLLVLLQEFDARKGWTNGFLSCAHWLSWRTGINMGAARERVRVARALPDLPLLSGALQRGEISYAKVRALTRIGSPENEERLLTIALCGTAAQVERLVRAWRWCDRREEERKHLWRSVSCWVDEDGMVILRARLTAEQGAIVQQALEAASDRLYRESRHAAPPERVAEEVKSDQRRADALTLIAESALSADFDRGSAADRHQVVMHVQADVPPVIELADGPISVSAETSRRIACDASVVVMHEGADGTLLDVGRKTRVVPASIRRALNARDDHRCAFPGCDARRCDAHHVVHWMDGGPTSLDNLVLLCRRHHTLLHDNGFTAERSHDGDAVFRRPDGRMIEVSPGLAWSGTGVVPAGVGARSLRVWDGTPLNLGYAIDVLRPQPEHWLPPLSGHV